MLVSVRYMGRGATVRVGPAADVCVARGSDTKCQVPSPSAPPCTALSVHSKIWRPPPRPGPFWTRPFFIALACRSPPIGMRRNSCITQTSLDHSLRREAARRRAGTVSRLHVLGHGALSGQLRTRKRCDHVLKLGQMLLHLLPVRLHFLLLDGECGAHGLHHPLHHT